MVDSTFENEVLERTLDLAFQEAGMDSYSFSGELKDIFQSHMGDYDTIGGFFDDLSRGGCASGMIGEFIYDSDIKDFFDRHGRDLEQFRSDLESEMGTTLRPEDGDDPVEYLVWLTAEEVGYRVSNELDSALDAAIEDAIDDIPLSSQDEVDRIFIEDIRNRVQEALEDSLATREYEDEGIDLDVQEEYYPDGTLKSREPMKDGQLHGDCEYYAQDGQLLSRQQFVNGDLDGIVVTYHPNGQKSSESHYSNGNREGVSQAWDEDGHLIRREVYESDRLTYENRHPHIMDNMPTVAALALNFYQPIHVKGGWIQLDMDYDIRKFKNDPRHISDDVSSLAKELVPALREELGKLGVPDQSIDRLITIKPEVEQDRSLGSGQSSLKEDLSQKEDNSRKKSLGL